MVVAQEYNLQLSQISELQLLGNGAGPEKYVIMLKISILTDLLFLVLSGSGDVRHSAVLSTVRRRLLEAP